MYKSECNSKRRRFSHNYHWQILWPVIDPNLWERISTMTNKILLLLAQFTSASVSGLAQAMASLQGRFPCSFLYCSIRDSTWNDPFTFEKQRTFYSHLWRRFHCREWLYFVQPHIFAPWSIPRSHPKQFDIERSIRVKGKAELEDALTN